MLKRLFSQQRPSRSALPNSSRPIYAIGDIHGRLDLLTPLLQTIRNDIETHALNLHRPMIVFLGDYIDRGPQSRAVVDSILALRQDPTLEIRTLKGNHEQALLLFLESPQFGPTWLAHGGATTLASYNIPPPGPRDEAAIFDKVRGAFRDALGDTHLQFFEGLEIFVQEGDYAFVHAGVRWGVPLHEQKEEDLLWIRQDFLNSDACMEFVIVHGHTPVEYPFLGQGRIGVDTGAYATGVLSAVRLWQTSQTILQSR
jgi:serine/threonine protein phosphatase 1